MSPQRLYWSVGRMLELVCETRQAAKKFCRNSPAIVGCFIRGGLVQSQGHCPADHSLTPRAVHVPCCGNVFHVLYETGASHPQVLSV